jgi:predicted RNA-binding protein YlxR (DUF448 family)
MLAKPHQSESELDRGARLPQRERLCIVTRAVRPVSQLIRFVVGPQGEAIPDLKCKLPGRGVWVTATQTAVEEAVKRKAFARGFKRDVRTPGDLAARTEALLQRAAIEALAIAGKAGLAATGFAKTAAALEHGDAIALLQAVEAAPDGVRKLNALLRQRAHAIAVIDFLTSAQLDLALGRPNVVHAALLAGSASDTFLSRARRLERFRTGGAGDHGNRAGNVDNPAVDMDVYD